MSGKKSRERRKKQRLAQRRHQRQFLEKVGLVSSDVERILDEMFSGNPYPILESDGSSMPPEIRDLISVDGNETSEVLYLCPKTLHADIALSILNRFMDEHGTGALFFDDNAFRCAESLVGDLWRITTEVLREFHLWGPEARARGIEWPVMIRPNGLTMDEINDVMENGVKISFADVLGNGAMPAEDDVFDRVGDILSEVLSGVSSADVTDEHAAEIMSRTKALRERAIGDMDVAHLTMETKPVPLAPIDALDAAQIAKFREDSFLRVHPEVKILCRLMKLMPGTIEPGTEKEDIEIIFEVADAMVKPEFIEIFGEEDGEKAYEHSVQVGREIIAAHGNEELYKAASMAIPYMTPDGEFLTEDHLAGG